MTIKDFIGKTVIRKETGERLELYEITSPVIEVINPVRDKNGVAKVLCYHTINGDPFENGSLVFEDETLLEPFKKAYLAHCLSTDGRMEEYGYWMRRD